LASSSSLGHFAAIAYKGVSGRGLGGFPADIFGDDGVVRSVFKAFVLSCAAQHAIIR
jgi:hypothetical protein